MRKLLLILFMVLVCLSLTVPVLAQDPPGPCDEFGDPGHSDYALHHIVDATANGSHVPGGHGGYARCLGKGRVFNQP